MPGFPVHHQLLELAQTHVHLIDFAIQPSHPLFPVLLLPLIFSSIRVFSNQSVLPMRRPKYWSFNFSISLSNENSGLISFGMIDLISLQSKGLSRVFSTPQSKSINSSTFSLLYGPALTFIHDHWKNYSFD